MSSSLTCSEDLHSVVLTITDEDVAIGHNSHTLQALEFAITRSPAAKGPKERTVRVEDLDAIVAAVSHKDVALVIHSHSSENHGRKKEFQIY